MNETSNLVFLMTMNTLGETIILQAFKEAYLFINGASTKAFKLSYMFINGSGLDLTINDYYLDYSAEKLRSTFFWKVRHAGT